ncbi:glycosyltransferase family 4 protein [Litorimonas sp. RW-G-Af-16]|uniref:glycosyltransferase family 4 protein n=1 Tax=Litorimonas sp. RW-G-Af-16 TaxID=3241168 RepID=UPI00390C54BC
MNVLQILPDLNAGGVERTTVEMVEALRAAGHGAHVLSHGGRLASEIERLGGVNHIADIGSKNILSVPWRIAGVRRLIAEHKIDVVHARSRAPAWPAMFAAKAERVSFLTTYHGIYNAKSAPKRLYNSVMARGDHIIANSDFTKAHILKTHNVSASKITTIYRGVDMTAFDPAKVNAADIAQKRLSWGVGPNQTIVLLPGRVTRWKGQGVAIAALADLPDDHVLILLGDAQGRDSLVAELTQQAETLGLTSRVVFAGHDSDVVTAYASADIVICPSIEPEAFGRTAAEAQAMGKPVIASAIGGALETVLDGQTGWLVPPNAPEALASAIRRSDDLSSVGAKARARIADNFSKTALQSATLAVYEKLHLGTFPRDKA